MSVPQAADSNDGSSSSSNPPTTESTLARIWSPTLKASASRAESDDLMTGELKIIYNLLSGHRRTVIKVSRDRGSWLRGRCLMMLGPPMPPMLYESVASPTMASGAFDEAGAVARPFPASPLPVPLYLSPEPTSPPFKGIVSAVPHHLFTACLRDRRLGNTTKIALFI